MKKITILLLLLLELMVSSMVRSQNIQGQYDQIYGLNPQLYNGKYYAFFLPSDTKRTPFFKDTSFVKGSITIKSISYNNLWLNYDIYNQALVLRYKTRSGNIQLLDVSRAWLQLFTLGDKDFELINLSGTSQQIFQVLGQGNIRVLYYWRRSLDLSISYGAKNFVFSKPVKRPFLQMGTTLKRYRNNKQFVRLFDSSRQAAITKYLKRNKVNVKKADDHAIVQLLHYCNSMTKQ